MTLLTAADDTAIVSAAAPAGGVQIAGWGAAVPQRRVTNHDLAGKALTVAGLGVLAVPTALGRLRAKRRRSA